MFTIAGVAELCHEVNRLYCASIGDGSQTSWEDAPQWQRDSAVNGVRWRLMNPQAHPKSSHQNWLQEKLREGWVYGPVKNPELKQHPCIVPFESLPREQQAKDYLFCSVVETLRETQQISEVL